MEEDDFRAHGKTVQAVYDRRRACWTATRRGGTGRSAAAASGACASSSGLRATPGLPEGPETLSQWRRVPEAFLATATNGQVFADPQGHFTAIREKLLRFYPEDVRIKKIVARAAVMAQAGQYNYPRCLRRGDTVAAQLALAEFTRAALSMVYLLNRRYAPFYKWMHRGLRGFGPSCRAPGSSSRRSAVRAARTRKSASRASA